MCMTKSFCWWNAAPHVSHWYGVTPVCTFWWSRNTSLFVKFLSHTVHQNAPGRDVRGMPSDKVNNFAKSSSEVGGRILVVVEHVVVGEAWNTLLVVNFLLQVRRGRVH